jgi:predicted metal-dependent phosphoesterase TrpH
MPEAFVDLHTHSLASDGTDSPADLVRKAAALGLSALALTDHDTLAGLAQAAAEAEKAGPEFVPGVEIAVKYGAGELHLLGLFVNPNSPGLTSALAEIRAGREGRNRAILDKLKTLGLPLTMEEVRALAGGQTVGRPHIALAMLGRGYVRSWREAFDRYLGAGRAAFVPRELPTPAAGIELIRNEGAIAVLAHPFLSPAMSAPGLDELLSRLRSDGLQALEAWHSAHNSEKIRICRDLARKHGLLASGGSDYHGRNKKDAPLGGGEERVPYAVLEALKNFSAKSGQGG